MLLRKKKEEPRLPTGLTEFEEWSTRIISKTGLIANKESQQFTLAAIIVQLKDNVAFIEDSFFVNSLIKAAASQVAGDIMTKIRLAQKTKAEVTPTSDTDGKVLEVQGI